MNVYGRLASRLDLEVRENIVYASPVWDIDGELERWRDVIEAARIIVDELERLGIARSVFVKWSGEGPTSTRGASRATCSQGTTPSTWPTRWWTTS